MKGLQRNIMNFLPMKYCSISIAILLVMWQIFAYSAQVSGPPAFGIFSGANGKKKAAKPVDTLKASDVLPQDLGRTDAPQFQTITIDGVSSQYKLYIDADGNIGTTLENYSTSGGTTSSSAEFRAYTSIDRVTAARLTQYSGHTQGQIDNTSALSAPTLQVALTGTDADAYLASSSTFSAWGFPIGAMQNFDSFKVVLNFWDTVIPSQIFVKIKENDKDGAILTQRIINLPQLTGSTSYTLTAELGRLITNTANTNLYMEMVSDGHFSPRRALPLVFPAPTYSMARYYTSALLVDTPTTCIGDGSCTDYSSQRNVFMSFYRNGALVPQSTGLVPYTESAFASSTFSNWGFPIGIKAPFNQIGFDLIWWDISVQPPKNCRVVIREVDDTGIILADVTVPLTDIKLNRFFTVIAPIPKIINNSGNLWMEFYTDSHVGFRPLNPIIYDVPAYSIARYGTSKTLNGSSVDSSVQTNIWNYTTYRNPDNLATTTSDYKTGILTLATTPATDIIVNLPTTIYAVEGVETNIYFANFINSHIDLADYRFNVTVSGTSNARMKQEASRWTFTPIAADAGTYTWTLEVYYNNTIIKTVTSSLIVKALTAGNGVTRKVLVIGDSTTAEGQWLAELQNLYVGDVMAIEEIGTITTVVNDSDGTSRTTNHEAISGMSVNYFYTDPASHFVFSSAFNFSTYLTTNALTMASGDWVFIHLGINDIFSYTTDTAALDKIHTTISQLSGMITNISSAVSGVRIGVLLPIPPSLSQDAFANNYYSGQTRWR